MKKSYCSFLPKQSDEVESCCQKHDQAYGVRGPATGRKRADLAMRQCFINRGMPPLQANLIYAAVRLFGWVRWYWIRFNNRKEDRGNQT